MDKTGYKIICGAPTTLAVKGLMMMMTLSYKSMSAMAAMIAKNPQYKKHDCVISFARCGSDATRGSGAEFCGVVRGADHSGAAQSIPDYYFFSVLDIYRHRYRCRNAIAPLAILLYLFIYLFILLLLILLDSGQASGC